MSRSRSASSAGKCCWWSTRRANAASRLSTKAWKSYTDIIATKGLSILGFPANDFGGQEPGSNKEIAQFCRLNYGVTFPMFAEDVRHRHKRKSSLSRARREDGEAAALELPQVPPRPGGAAGRGVRKCRRACGFTGHFADRETARCALTHKVYISRLLKNRSESFDGAQDERTGI